jgi:uncharacterized phage-associated protein
MKINKNLIGNIMVLLAERCKPLYHTKLLKILYLIDEEATKKTGAPITWLSYNVWQYGPVSEDVYFSKIEGLNKFADFVRFDHIKGDQYIIKPITAFDDSDFSELDLQIIDDIIVKYGHLNAKQLVDIVHAKGSLWEKTKSASDIQFSKQNKTSPVTLNFAELLQEDNFKKTVYYNTLENIEVQSTLHEF